MAWSLLVLFSILLWLSWNTFSQAHCTLWTLLYKYLLRKAILLIGYSHCKSCDIPEDNLFIKCIYIRSFSRFSILQNNSSQHKLNPSRWSLSVEHLNKMKSNAISSGDNKCFLFGMIFYISMYHFKEGNWCCSSCRQNEFACQEISLYICLTQTSPFYMKPEDFNLFPRNNAEFRQLKYLISDFIIFFRFVTLCGNHKSKGKKKS